MGKKPRPGLGSNGQDLNEQLLVRSYDALEVDWLIALIDIQVELFEMLGEVAEIPRAFVTPPDVPRGTFLSIVGFSEGKAAGKSILKGFPSPGFAHSI